MKIIFDLEGTEESCAVFAIYAGLRMYKEQRSLRIEDPNQFSIAAAEAYCLLEQLNEQHPTHYLEAKAEFEETYEVYKVNNPNAFSDYQSRIADWLVQCFGEQISNDILERCFRFAEESMELVQSLGVTKSQMQELVEYTFNRPLGEPHQEVGGVMVTLAALCHASKLSMWQSGENEYQRIITKIEKIREKHFSKPANIVSNVSKENK